MSSTTVRLRLSIMKSVHGRSTSTVLGWWPCLSSTWWPAGAPQCQRGRRHSKRASVRVRWWQAMHRRASASCAQQKTNWVSTGGAAHLAAGVHDGAREHVGVVARNVDGLLEAQLALVLLGRQRVALERRLELRHVRDGRVGRVLDDVDVVLLCTFACVCAGIGTGGRTARGPCTCPFEHAPLEPPV